MGAESIVAIGFVLLLIGGVVAGGISLYRRGKLTAQLKDAKGDAREATNQIKRRTDPVRSDSSYYERLRRASERLARLRDRASK